MATRKDYVAIPRSVRTPLAGAQVVGDVDPGELIDVTVRLRSRSPAHQLANTVRTIAAQHPGKRKHMTREEFATAHGAAPGDLDQIKAFASQNGLAVADASVARRSVHLRGSADAMNKAFGITLKHYRHKAGTYRSYAEPVTVPQQIAPLVEAIVGFDTRPHVRPHFRVTQKPKGSATAHAASLDFNPTDLGNIYRFPANSDGAGQVIGIIEMMMPNGSGFRLSELQTYFQSLGVSTPEIVVVSVDGGANVPGGPGTDINDPQSGDGEVMLDIEVIGALAPKAKLVVYFAPNTGQGFLDAINKAVHDSDNNPSVISLSWGGAEDANDPTTDQINQILQGATAMGVTFCVASGDSGSRDNPSDPQHAAVDFPASSPFSLGCGGTQLTVSGTTITDEVVWEGQSGGGVSRIFDLPDYQASAGVPPAKNPDGPVRRGVPDVAGDADPATGYRILVDDQNATFGGTSAVAPLWAALSARLNQKLGHPVGFLNQFLYTHTGVFRDITSGSNIDYQAGPGWDPCTGLGSPDGTKLLEALGSP
jgi:kumamolisin